MYKNLNEPFSDHSQRLELELAEWRKGEYGCCTARTDEELTQRDCRDKAALPRQGSYLFRIKVTAFHWNKMGAVCNLTARQDTAEWCFC